MKGIFGCIALVALVACSSGPPAITMRPIDNSDIPPPLAVVPTTDTDARACARLSELHCPEAKPARGTCLDTFRHNRTNEIEAGSIDRVSACVAGAADIAAVRKCGGPNTLTFDC